MKTTKFLFYMLLVLMLALLLTACAQTNPATQETIVETTLPIETASPPAEVPVETIPTEEPLRPCAVNYLFYDEDEVGKVQIRNYAVLELEETYHFILEYTATEPMQLEGYLSTSEATNPFLEESISSDGGSILEFDILKETAAQYTQMDIFFVPETGENIALSVYFPIRIQMTSGEPVEEPLRPGYTLRKKWKSDAYQIHDCYMQHLDNDYIRCTLDISLPKRAYFSVYLIGTSENTLALQTFSINGRHQYVFDISAEALDASREVNILICEEQSRYENLISIPCGSLTALTDGRPVTEPTSLGFHTKKKKGYDFHGCTIQKLDNGCYRYTLNYTAPEN